MTAEAIEFGKEKAMHAKTMFEKVARAANDYTANGNFAVEPMAGVTKDQGGQMTHCLYASARGGIGRILLNSVVTTEVSELETKKYGSENEAKAARIGRPGSRVCGLTTAAHFEGSHHLSAKFEDAFETAEEYSPKGRTAKRSSPEEPITDDTKLSKEMDPHKK